MDCTTAVHVVYGLQYYFYVSVCTVGAQDAQRGAQKPAQTQDLITSFKLEQMDYSPYSSDLAPSDFDLFLRLKKFLGGKRFDDDDDLQDAVLKWRISQAAEFYEEGIQKLVPRHD